MTIAPLLKQNAALSFYFSLNLLERKGAGAVVRDAIHTIQPLFKPPNLPLGLYGATAGIFHKLRQFPRQNCCEEVCFLREAWEPRAIFRKYRRAFIHLLLSFSFPCPRLLGPLTPTGWQCHLPHHDGARDSGEGCSFWGMKCSNIRLWWWLTVNEYTKNYGAHILSGRILWCVIFQ